MSARGFWLTGLSSAGKSTIAAELSTLIAGRGVTPVLLDGDRLRDALPWRPGYEREERLQLAQYYGRLVRDFVLQGHTVICATISLFHTVHDWNRENIPGYFEVWLRAPASELRERDKHRGIYDAPSKVIGRDSTPEFPRAADLVIDNDAETVPRQAAERVLAVSAWRPEPCRCLKPEAPPVG